MVVMLVVRWSMGSSIGVVQVGVQGEVGDVTAQVESARRLGARGKVVVGGAAPSRDPAAATGCDEELAVQGAWRAASRRGWGSSGVGVVGSALALSMRCRRRSTSRLRRHRGEDADEAWRGGARRRGRALGRGSAGAWWRGTELRVEAEARPGRSGWARTAWKGQWWRRSLGMEQAAAAARPLYAHARASGRAQLLLGVRAHDGTRGAHRHERRGGGAGAGATSGGGGGFSPGAGGAGGAEPWWRRLSSWLPSLGLGGGTPGPSGWLGQGEVRLGHEVGWRAGPQREMGHARGLRCWAWQASSWAKGKGRAPVGPRSALGRSRGQRGGERIGP